MKIVKSNPTKWEKKGFLSDRVKYCHTRAFVHELFNKQVRGILRIKRKLIARSKTRNNESTYNVLEKLYYCLSVRVFRRSQNSE